MDITLVMNIINTFINSIGLIGIFVLLVQFAKEIKNDKKEQTKERKIQRGKPILSIWNDALDSIDARLDSENDVWLVDPEQIKSIFNGHHYYVHLSLPHNRFIKNAKVNYWRYLAGANGSSLEIHKPCDLGTISPDNNYVQPISKDEKLLFFIYSIEYQNEINEFMQFTIVAIMDKNSNGITKIYDILCKKRDDKKINHSKIFSDSAWVDFKKKLGKQIVDQLHNSVLGNEENWEYLSYTEKVIEKTCSAKVIKSKLEELKIK